MSELPRSRRLAREMAFQALYMVEVGSAEPGEAALAVLQRQMLAPESATFLRALVGGCCDNRLELDATISAYLARNWGIDRLAVTDLVALRLAVFELFHLPGMPPKVSISQAVELAKRYGVAESGRFVNGVLANVLLVSPKANWDPSQEEVREEEFDYDPRKVDPEDESDDAVVEVNEGTPEAEELAKIGAWLIRTPEEAS